MIPTPALSVSGSWVEVRLLPLSLQLQAPRYTIKIMLYIIICFSQITSTILKLIAREASAKLMPLTPFT